MNLSFFIARRYFFTKKKRNFINIISNISMAGAAIGTMALIIVLSVFNGLEDLLRSLYDSFDAEIKISAVEGKSFEYDEALYQKIKSVKGVKVITEVIEDNALLKYRDAQTIVRMKGVTDNYFEQNNLKSALRAGEPLLKKDGINHAILGSGLQYSLSVSLNNEFFPLEIWYPRAQKNISLNPETAFNKDIIRAGAVFSIEKAYDENYMIAPLSFVRDVMNYKNKRTSLEIKTEDGVSVREVQANLKNALGGTFYIQNRDEQHESLYKAIKIEKLFGYITFSFILGIACFNIFFSLTMLAIEKKRDIAILYAIGATQNTVKRIFLFEGALIAFSGSFVGLFLGVAICWLQQTYGFVSMGMQTSIMDAYPIKIEIMDLVLTTFSIIIITLIVAYSPAKTAANIDIKSHI